MEGNEKCIECQKAIGNEEGVYECDACVAVLHKACAGLTPSEGKCMPLQKRTLRLLCSKCKKFIIKLPKLICIVEEMKNEIVALKEVVLNANVNQMKEVCENAEEGMAKYSEVVSRRKKEVVVIKPKDESQRSSITKQNIQQAVDPAALGDGVGVSKLKYVRKGGISMSCNSKEPIENVCKKLEERLGENYEIKRVDKKNPKIKIKNVDKRDLENEMLFVEKMTIQNMIKTDTEKRIIKILHKYTPKVQKNQNNMNVILEVDPKTFETVIKNKVVHIGWKTCKIEEHINVIQCLKCRKFGHTIKQCKNEKVVCAECAGEHESCKSEIKICVNCKYASEVLKIPEINYNHAAYDRNNCSAYVRIREQIRMKVDYPTSLNKTR